MWFVYGQLEYFNEAMLKLERQKTSAVDVAIIRTELKLNLYAQKKSYIIILFHTKQSVYWKSLRKMK